MRFEISLLLLLAGSMPLSAHLGTEAELAELERRLEQERDPRRLSALYLRRGELHRGRRDWPAAAGDFLRAREDPALAAADFHLARALLEAGWPLRARLAIDRFLLNAARSGRAPPPEALALRGRVLAAIGRFLEAAEAFSQALASLKPAARPAPDLFLERARALEAAGDEHLGEAIRGLDEGLARLGGVASLLQLAVELVVKSGRIDGALARLDAAASRSLRPETWLARRGAVLEAAGRLLDAQEAYRQAAARLRRLEVEAPARRRTRAMEQLAEEIQQALERLSGRARPGKAGNAARQRAVKDIRRLISGRGMGRGR